MTQIFQFIFFLLLPSTLSLHSPSHLLRSQPMNLPTPTFLPSESTPFLPTGPLLVSKMSSLTLQIPTEKVDKIDQYRCGGVDISNLSLSVTGWKPLPTYPEKTHHMTMYFCDNVGNTAKTAMGLKKTWICDTPQKICDTDTESGEFGPGYENMASEKLKTVPPISFPKNTILPLGKDTKRKYAVIQVHNNAPLEKDSSGFELMLRNKQEQDQDQIQDEQLFFQITWDVTTTPTDVPIFQKQIRQGLKPGIPPNKLDFTVQQNWIVSTKNHQDGPFTVFMVHLHYHSLGIKSTLELKRKNEKEWIVLAQRIGKESASKYLLPVVEIHGGDTLRQTVEWDSSHRDVHTPFGMDAFDNEMGQAFLLCYGKKNRQVLWGVDLLPTSDLGNKATDDDIDINMLSNKLNALFAAPKETEEEPNASTTTEEVNPMMLLMRLQAVLTKPDGLKNVLGDEHVIAARKSTPVVEEFCTAVEATGPMAALEFLERPEVMGALMAILPEVLADVEKM